MVIKNYDEAIASLNNWKLETAEYRNALANAWVNRVVAQEKLGSPADLKAAIASFDEAIALQNQLPLSAANIARIWQLPGRTADPAVNTTFFFWHIYVSDLRPGAHYAYRRPSRLQNP